MSRKDLGEDRLIRVILLINIKMLSLPRIALTMARSALLALMAANALASAAGAAPWARGVYGRLAFAADGSSYTFAYGPIR